MQKMSYLKIAQSQLFLRTPNWKFCFLTLSSNLPPPTAAILPYVSSAQQALTGEPQENIRKLIVIILTLNSNI